MDMCVRCNPAWQLQTDEAGKQFCPICGDRFIKEVHPAPVAEPVSTDVSAEPNA